MIFGNTSIQFRTFGKCKVEDVKYWRIYYYKRVRVPSTNGKVKYKNVKLWKTRCTYTMDELVRLHSGGTCKMPKYCFLVAMPRASQLEVNDIAFERGVTND